jgi:enamine deaminase RidA (YjgF/YER057c/UK114 family)
MRAVTKKDRAMSEIGRRDVVAASVGAVVLGGLVGLQAANGADAVGSPAEERRGMDIHRIGIIEPASGIPIVTVAPIISLAAVHAGLVHVSGVTADPTRLGDVKDQTKQVLDRIDLLLKRAGTDKSRLLSAQVWLTDMSLFVDHNEAWNAWVDPKNPPVRACLHSAKLWAPGMLVEIMATAAL